MAEIPERGQHLVPSAAPLPERPQRAPGGPVLSPDSQLARTEIIREICGKEGHGVLLEVTSYSDSHQRFICQRGCGIEIYRLRRQLTFSQLLAWTGADEKTIRVGAGQYVEVIR